MLRLETAVQCTLHGAYLGTREHKGGLRGSSSFSTFGI